MKTAYKLLRVKDGKLFPMFVLADESLPLHVYLKAREGQRLPSGKVRSKLGPLAFRPGFHLCELPLATHIGVERDGVIAYMHPDTVWCRCSYSDKKDYQHEADLMGMKNGKVIRQKACLKHVPVDGYYHYKTSPRMYGDRIIAGGITIDKVLSDGEVADILAPYGLTPPPRLETLDISAFSQK